jgi:hypothetical protein
LKLLVSCGWSIHISAVLNILIVWSRGWIGRAQPWNLIIAWRLHWRHTWSIFSRPNRIDVLLIYRIKFRNLISIFKFIWRFDLFGLKCLIDTTLLLSIALLGRVMVLHILFFKLFRRT